MTGALWPNGRPDLPRGRRWALPDGDTALAFKDAALGILAFVTQQTDVSDVFAEIGGGVYKSIAPITRSSGRSNVPRTPAYHASNDDILALNYFDLAQDHAAASTRHMSADLFRKIGEHTLRTSGHAMVTSRLSPDAQVSHKIGKPKHADNLDDSIAPYLHHVDAAMPPYTPAGRTFSSIPRHDTFKQDNTLPSLAPKSLQRGLVNAHQPIPSPNQYGAAEDEPARRTTMPRDVKHLPSQTQVKRALDSLLDQQARRAPAGPTGFDTSLTPSWAGLKLPH